MEGGTGARDRSTVWKAVPVSVPVSRTEPVAELPVQVFTPQRLSLPRPSAYLRDLWDRRHFAYQLARTDLRTKNAGTFFGQLWLVINPLLLAAVYYLLVNIVRDRDRGADFLAHLVACLFAFQLVSTCVKQGSRAVIKSGKLILNTAFPRSLLPISSAMTAFVRFVPTMAVYAVVHVVVGLPVGPHLLWALPLMLMLGAFALGVSLFLSALQVYFRDLANFLPYLMRVWLYTSPILYYADEVPNDLGRVLAFNPLFSMLAAWSQVLNEGGAPDGAYLLQGALWAGGALVLGALFFVSREREFAVRL